MNQVSTLFVVKDEAEFCFLFDENNPATLFDTLFENSNKTEGSLNREDVFEVIEGIVPSRLRAI